MVLVGMNFPVAHCLSHVIVLLEGHSSTDRLVARKRGLSLEAGRQHRAEP